MEPDTSSDALKTRIEAKLAALPPDERAKLEESLAESFAEMSATWTAAERYHKDLLHRLGVRGDVDDFGERWLQMLAAAEYVGIAPARFWEMTPHQICAVLEHRATELALERGSQDGPGSRRASKPKELGQKGGRPVGVYVNGHHLKECRGELSQEDFADKCRVSVATIQRGEAGGRWTDATFEKVRLAVPPEDCKNLKK